MDDNKRERKVKVSEENKKLIEQFFETVVNQRKSGALADFVASAGGGTCGGKGFRQLVVDPDPTRAAVLDDEAREAAREKGFELHARLVPPTSRPRGAPESLDVDAMRDMTEHVLQAFPDMNVNIESMIAEGDQVVVRWNATGTHRGEYLGTPATGRTVPFSSVDIFTVKDGQIVDLVSQPNTAAVLDALGHLPATPVARAFGLRGAVT